MRACRELLQLGASFSLVVTLSVSEGSHEMLRCAQHDKPERDFRPAVLLKKLAAARQAKPEMAEGRIRDALPRRLLI